MRLSALVLALLLASSAGAQSDPFRFLSLGVGPATGFTGPAGYTELRADFALSPVLSVQPLVGVTGEAGRVEVSPCQIPPCSESRVDRGVWVAPGLGFALRVPEAALPRGVASAHLGAFGQSAFQKGRSTELRYGVEVGASARVSPLLTVGAALQASRHARRGFDGEGLFVERTSIVPMLRLTVGG